MDFQTAFDLAIAVAGFLGGFILKAVWDGLKDLRMADKGLAEKVSSIEILVAGQYVKRDDIDKLTLALFAKLDKIEAKLDGKADK